MLSRRHALSLAAALAAGPFALAAPVLAQAFPNKQITVIVPFAAGGPTDVATRLVAEHMSRTLGQTLVVENVAGAGGTTGMSRVAAAAPDGYTIGVGNVGTQSASVALYANLKYDPAKSFDQIGIVNYNAMVISAKKALEPANLKAFIDWAKAGGDKVTYAHAGVGSTSHVAGILFHSMFGLKPGLVAYRGTAPAMNDLVAGQVDFLIDQTTNVVPQVKAGTIKAYAIAAPERLAAMPDVPTTKEAGIDFIFSGWNAMVAPKGLPADVNAKIVDALNKALDDKAVQDKFAELSSTLPKGADRGPAGLQKLVESEVARIKPALAAAGVQPQ
jgi:tripartite-type tricarboxylate transporter receptor subunit TctC